MQCDALNAGPIKAIRQRIGEWPSDMPLVLIGPNGIGKKSAFFAVAHESEGVLVDVRAWDFFQMEDLVNACCGGEQNGTTHDPTLYLSSVNACLNECMANQRFVYFDNMGNCDSQHVLLLKNYMMYCTTNGMSFQFIFAFQDTSELIVWPELRNSEWVCFDYAPHDVIKAFLETKMSAHCDNSLAAINKVVALSGGNVGLCEAVLRILVDLGILTYGQGKLSLVAPEEITRIPATIGELYGMQLAAMGESRINALAAALPFGGDIHISAINRTGWITNAPSEYREIHRLQQSILTRNETANPERLFDRSYRIDSQTARIALADKRECAQVTQHFRNGFAPILSGASRDFDALDFTDQYELLIWASGLDASRADAERIGRLVELLFLNGYFARVCEVVERYLCSRPSGGMNWLLKKSPRTPDLYLDSLYNLGRYDELINRFGQLSHPSARHQIICAKAYYALDCLDKSHSLALTASNDRAVKADALLLLSSIANWQDDTHAQTKYITQAVRALGGTTGFEGIRTTPFASISEMRAYYSQLELRKKYALILKDNETIGIEVERLCDSITEKGLTVCPPLARPYAEILHNYGTELVKKEATRAKGLEYLQMADSFFASICDPDRYCTQNSIAMSECFSGNYVAACERFATLMPPQGMPFCAMAVRNNEWMARRKTGDFDGAEKAKLAVEATIHSLLHANCIPGPIDKERVIKLGDARPDVKLQLKHYSINRALDWRSCAETQSWLETAEAVSNSISSSCYLVTKLLDQFEDSSRVRRGATWRRLFHKRTRTPARSTIDYWFGSECIYFCEIMFWG